MEEYETDFFLPDPKHFPGILTEKDAVEYVKRKIPSATNIKVRTHRYPNGRYRIVVSFRSTEHLD